MINFTAGAGQYRSRPARPRRSTTIVTSRAFVEKAQARQAGRAARRRQSRFVYLEDVRGDDRPADKLRALCCVGKRPLRRSASPTIRRRSCSPRARKARPRASCCRTATCSPMPRRRAARIDFGRADKVFNVLPVFHSFGLTGGLVLPLVSRRADLSLSVAAALSDRAGADLRHQRHHPVRHRHVPRRLCPRRRIPTTSARCATSSPAPSR